MDQQDMLGVLMGMTEQQQKAIAEAVEDLKQQTAHLDGLAPGLQQAVQVAVVAALAKGMGDLAQGAETAVKASVVPVLQSLGGVVEAANQAEAKLNKAVAAFGWRWLLLASMSTAGAILALLVTVYAAVWWERTELDSLKAEQATLQENIAKFDQLKGHIRLATCGEDKRPCAEVETTAAYGEDEGHRYYILKGVK
jgi:prefoldin subunit 5